VLNSEVDDLNCAVNHLRYHQCRYCCNTYCVLKRFDKDPKQVPAVLRLEINVYVVRLNLTDYSYLSGIFIR
jgi:hypothetical protein